MIFCKMQDIMQLQNILFHSVILTNILLFWCRIFVFGLTLKILFRSNPSLRMLLPSSRKRTSAAGCSRTSARSSCPLPLTSCSFAARNRCGGPSPSRSAPSSRGCLTGMTFSYVVSFTAVSLFPNVPKFRSSCLCGVNKN